jgi:predicted RNA binding protein YcfA (HicA-like mRNA interferase family)
MKDYSKPVKEILDKHGWSFLRHGGKGSHDIWQSPSGNKTVSVNKNMKSRHTANDILSQAGINERFR